MEDSRWVIRPMWFNTALYVALWTAFVGSVYLEAGTKRSLTTQDVYIALGAVGGGVLVGLYLLFLHYVSVEPAALMQRRWLGLGNRTIPLASIRRVSERSGQNWYGATIRTYVVKAEHGQLKLSGAIYWPRDLRRLVKLLRERGIPVSAGVVHHLKLDGALPLHWWE
jgi:hypothetical protein